MAGSHQMTFFDVTILTNDTKLVSRQIMVKFGDDLIIHLKMNIGDIIVSVRQLPTCYACREDIPNQTYHMDCPYGCLHDLDACDVCTPL